MMNGGSKMARVFTTLLMFWLSATALGATDSRELIVAAHYAPWYRGPGGGNWSFQLGKKTLRTAYKPLLGYYNNLSPSVLNKHITWAEKYGINTFMIEWNGQDTLDFFSPLDISMQAFLQNPNFKRIDFFFVYSLVSALKLPGDPEFAPVDLNRRAALDKMVTDFRYASRYYLQLSHYLKIDKRPVIYLWAVPLAQGNLKKAVIRVRNVVKAETGQDPFIIADVVSMTSDPDPAVIRHFDAVMPYLMLEVNGYPPQNYALKDSTDAVIERYRFFHYACQDLETHFVPAVFPGFDAVGAPWCYDGNKRLTTPTVKRTVPAFKEFVVQAKSFVDPEINMLYITSWSEWNEGTNIEPSTRFKYKYLNALKKSLARPPSEQPASNRLRFKFSRVVKPIGNDNRLLGASFQWVEFLDADLNPLLTLDIGTPKARKSMGWGWYQNENEPPDGATFCWAGGKKKYATLYVDVPSGARFLKLILRQVDDQRTTIHIDDRWITQIQGNHAWRWAQHIISLD
jgi:hypothetical protein